MTRQMADDEVLRPIERDDSIGREYIPLPGGWEVQTKGTGSTFRLVNMKDGDRLAIPESPYLHGTLTLMAREIHDAASARRAEIEAKDRLIYQLRYEANSNLAALQAERDADKAALEALRGQVAGLLNTCVDVIEEGLCARQSYDYRARAEGCAEQIKELLAIKGKMG